MIVGIALCIAFASTSLGVVAIIIGCLCKKRFNPVTESTVVPDWTTNYQEINCDPVEVIKLEVNRAYGTARQ